MHRCEHYRQATGAGGPAPHPEGGDPARADWRQHRKAGLLIAPAAAAVVLLVVLINLTHTTPSASAPPRARWAHAAGSSQRPAPAARADGASGAASSNGIPTINGATLPVMQTSGAADRDGDGAARHRRTGTE